MCVALTPAFEAAAERRNASVLQPLHVCLVRCTVTCLMPMRIVATLYRLHAPLHSQRAARAPPRQDYFVCTNKGCDTSKPLALDLQDPSNPNSNFTMQWSFVMPAKNATGDFRMVAYGQDQDHSPYDFDLT